MFFPQVTLRSKHNFLTAKRGVIVTNKQRITVLKSSSCNRQTILSCIQCTLGLLCLRTGSIKTDTVGGMDHKYVSHSPHQIRLGGKQW